MYKFSNMLSFCPVYVVLHPTLITIQKKMGMRNWRNNIGNLEA